MLLAALGAGTLGNCKGGDDDAEGRRCEAGERCGDAEASACAPLDVALPKADAEVVFLIDQSGTGLCLLDGPDPCDGDTRAESEPGTRWNATRDALLRSDGPIAELGARVSVGLAFYSNVNDEPACPELATPEVVRGDVASIKAAYAAQKTRDHQPTAEAVAALSARLVEAGGGPKYLVLVTNGFPDTCEDVDANGRPEAVDAAVGAIEAAFERGVTTFVVGMSRDRGDLERLQRFALAGQGLPPGAAGPAYFAPGAERDLAPALERMAFGERACSFSLAAPLSDEAAAQSRAALDGEALGFGAPDGWRLAQGGRAIELVDGACERIKRGASRLSFTPACGRSPG